MNSLQYILITITIFVICGTIIFGIVYFDNKNDNLKDNIPALTVIVPTTDYIDETATILQQFDETKIEIMKMEKEIDRILEAKE